ncbi:MAG TPA: hypothetical protein VIH16_09885 [Bellilinea sp.]
MTQLPLDGVLLLAACLLAFVLVQRWLHRELQAVFLLLTRRPVSALGLFSLLFFPGVLLHEMSHYIMARLLGVRTGRLSLFPKVLANGTLRLGFVETAATDPLRDTLIGAAPLISGMAVVSYLGFKPLGILPLTNLLLATDWTAFWSEAAQLPSRPDFWLWFYLAFAVSSTMLPSASDRRAWWSVALVFGIVLVVAILPGVSSWMLENLASPVNRGLRTLAVLFAASGIIHLVLAPPAWLAKILLSRITGLRVV